MPNERWTRAQRSLATFAHSLRTQGRPSVSVYVVIPTYGQYDLTAECLCSLRRLSTPVTRVVIVDNASRDDTPSRVAAEFVDIADVIRLQDNLGYAGGCNVGIRYALARGASYVLLLNNDTVVAPDLVDTLLARIRSNHVVGAVTPKILFLHQPELIWAAGGSVNWWLARTGGRGRGQLDRGQYERAEQVDYLSGCCLLASRAALETVGLLDTRYFAYFEDADWCYRAKQAGLQVWYEPSTIVWHVAGATAKTVHRESVQRGSAFTTYLLTRNNLWFITTHTFGLRRLGALMAFFLRRVLCRIGAYLATGRVEHLKQTLRGMRDGLRQRPAPSGKV